MLKDLSSETRKKEFSTTSQSQQRWRLIADGKSNLRKLDQKESYRDLSAHIYECVTMSQAL